MDNSPPIAGSISHYRIIKKLGSGGMGEVYLADDTRLARKVAIKMLSRPLIADEQARQRMLREARAAAALDHPNICTIHEVGEDDGRAFIVMQYIEGNTLASKITHGSFDLRESVEVGIQVAEALAAAHSNGIIHRDIKPQNIMLTQRGQAKILDFGLAKVVTSGDDVDGEAETQPMLTQSGVILGTVPYMSPEQARGESIDARSDIFSFGAALYEMISGVQPFAARTAAETISLILMSEPRPLSSYSPGAPIGLARIVHKCLEKKRERRYQSCAAIAADLQAVRGKIESAAAGNHQATATTLMDGDRSGTLSRLTGSPQLLVATLFLLATVASVYALFFRGTAPAALPATKSFNSPAYDDYMRGHVLVNSENREDNENAIKLLKQATRADPSFAPAWADLARALHVKEFYFAPEAEKKLVSLEAQTSVAKALDLDPNLADAHYARALVLWSPANRFPHAQVIHSYNRALALNPDLDEAHHRLGVVYSHIGLFDKAWTEIEKALEINSSNTLARFRLGVVRLYETRYEEALTLLQGIPQDANPALAGRTTATALFQLGRLDEAEALVDDLLKNLPNDEGGSMTSVKAMLLAKAGRAQESEAAIQRAITVGKGFGHFHHTAYNIGSAYALLSRPAEAVTFLQAAADDGFPCYPWFDKDANLDSLRKDDRFIALMARLRKQWEEYRATL